MRSLAELFSDPQTIRSDDAGAGLKKLIRSGAVKTRPAPRVPVLSSIARRNQLMRQATQLARRI